jgi:hypothetical protein
MNAWHDEARRRVSGGAAAELRGVEDWPPVLDEGVDAWAATQERLSRGARDLLETVRSLEDGELHEAPAGSRDTRYFTLHGIVQHALYHAGQIAVLKRLKGEVTR